jgi:hypothetical protein
MQILDGSIKQLILSSSFSISADDATAERMLWLLCQDGSVYWHRWDNVMIKLTTTKSQKVLYINELVRGTHNQLYWPSLCRLEGEWSTYKCTCTFSFLCSLLFFYLASHHALASSYGIYAHRKKKDLRKKDIEYFFVSWMGRWGGSRLLKKVLSSLLLFFHELYKNMWTQMSNANICPHVAGRQRQQKAEKNRWKAREKHLCVVRPRQVYRH